VTTIHWWWRTQRATADPNARPGNARVHARTLKSALDEAAVHSASITIDLAAQLREILSGCRGTVDQQLVARVHRVGADTFGTGRAARRRLAAGRPQAQSAWGMADDVLSPALRQGSSARLHLGANGAPARAMRDQDMGSGTYTALGQLAAEALVLSRSPKSASSSATPNWPEGPFLFSGGSHSHLAVSCQKTVEMSTAEMRAKLCAAIEDPASPSPNTRKRSRFIRYDPRSSTATPVNAIARCSARRAPQGIQPKERLGSRNMADDRMGFGRDLVEARRLPPILAECGFGASRHFRRRAHPNPLLAKSPIHRWADRGIGMALHERTAVRQNLFSGAINRRQFRRLTWSLCSADMPFFDIVLSR